MKAINRIAIGISVVWGILFGVAFVVVLCAAISGKLDAGFADRHPLAWLTVGITVVGAVVGLSLTDGDN